MGIEDLVAAGVQVVDSIHKILPSARTSASSVLLYQAMFTGLSMHYDMEQERVEIKVEKTKG